jgi:Zn-dependent protease with chaperone function
MLLIQKHAIIAVISLTLFPTYLTSQDKRASDAIIDFFFKRYKDYPQLFQEMAFIIGNWDFLEAKLRNEVSQVFEQRYKVYPGETVIGRSIVAVSNRPTLPYEMRYTFQVIDVPGINAFAIPGGGVYITRDFLKKINENPNPEARLAFVFGHEVAHVTQRHWISSLKQQYVGEFWSWAASELSKKSSAEFLRQVVPTILQAVFAGYSRDNEREADSLGIVYMTRAGFDLNGSVDALEMLAAVGSGGYTIWSSHPKIQERVEFARRMKSSHETAMSRQIEQAVSDCDSKSGILAINIQQPSGYFPEIGTDTDFDEFALLFFNVEEVRKQSGEKLSVPVFSSYRPGQYHRVLPVGNYVLFYRAKSWKRWFTPFRMDASGWGPLRISVKPKAVTFVSVLPRGERSQVYDYTWGVPSPRSSIDYEFVQRFVLENEPESRFAVDFSPLPQNPPKKENTEVWGSSDIIEQKGRLVMPREGLEILTSFTMQGGSPQSARLTVAFSSSSESAGSSAYANIKVNGQVLTTDQMVDSQKPLAYSWEITKYVSAGKNTLSIIRSQMGDSLGIHSIQIDVRGAGLGNFYDLKSN